LEGWEEGRERVGVQLYRSGSGRRCSVMIGVPIHGFIFGHSMPPTLPKPHQIEYIYKNIIKKYIFQNFTNVKINIRIFINMNNNL
jgi:hypothetical protein